MVSSFSNPKLEALILASTVSSKIRRNNVCVSDLWHRNRHRGFFPGSPPVSSSEAGKRRSRRRIGDGDRVFVEAAEEIDGSSQEDEAEEDAALGH